MSANSGDYLTCAHCPERIERKRDGDGFVHVTAGGEPAEPYHYGEGGGRYGMHLATHNGSSPS